MTTNKYDIIVIGAGHNGLTTANFLARAGKSVLVVEKNDFVGGIASGVEFHPGYKSAGILHSTAAVREHVIEKLQLKKFGLQTTGIMPDLHLLSKTGQSITISDDLERSSHSIAAVNKKDAAAYKDYRRFTERIGKWLGKLLNEKQPDLANLTNSTLWQLVKKGVGLRSLGKETMLELLKVMPMCAADFLNERFETEFLKAGLVLPALLGSQYGPWAGYTTTNLLLHESTCRNQVLGGPTALTSALEQAALNNGVEIRTNADVSKIILDKGIVTGIRVNNKQDILADIVASSCTPTTTFHKFFRSNEIGPKLDAEIARYRSRGTTVKIDLALNKKIQWKHSSEKPIEFAITADNFTEIEQAADSVKYREYSEKPVLDIFIPTVQNPTLAPQDHEVVSILAQYAPYNLKGGWTEKPKQEFLTRVMKQLENYAVDLTGSIVATSVTSPLDLAEQFGLTGGHMYHGEHALDQLINRPLPSCAQYKTPIPGLYLCGSGTHPGGGITCMPGALAAMAIIDKK